MSRTMLFQILKLLRMFLELVTKMLSQLIKPLIKNMSHLIRNPHTLIATIFLFVDLNLLLEKLSEF